MPQDRKLTVPLQAARRLAIVRQRLAGPRPPATRRGILDLVRHLRYLQIDPIPVVARSHTLVLWSRLGPYDVGDLQALLWRDRSLFEYWAHGASIVLTEDYPLHRLRMRRYPTTRFAHGRRSKEWIAANPDLRRHVLARLRRDGPLRLQDFEDRAVAGWTSSGWTSGRNVERMLGVLWTQGRVVVAGRSGPVRLWTVADGWFPDWTPRESLSEKEVMRRATQHSLRALGIATPRQIQDHFAVAPYSPIGPVVDELTRRGTLVPAHIEARDGELPGSWFMHEGDVELLGSLSDREWQGRTTLLSPFDNLIIDRTHTEALFGFRYRMEIYVPKHLRQHGYYVMPVLHGDRLIGRMDLRNDRGRATLIVHAAHAEPDAPADRSTAASVRGSLEELATFVGAASIDFERRGTERWTRWLR